MQFFVALLVLICLSHAPSSASSSNSTNSQGANAALGTPLPLHLPYYGKLVGIRTSATDSYYGLPYASPPVGSLRFAPPQPPLPWFGTLDATKPPPDCWQPNDPTLNPYAKEMSEDCLYISVHTPAGHAQSAHQGSLLNTILNTKSPLLPVLVWIHGGAFIQGGANRPEYKIVADKNVVVITLQYRLGALGWLVAVEDGLTGNYGLMDQRAALDWVHNNAKYFGGDSDQVTLFGESAGAVMIGQHLMMEGAGGGERETGTSTTPTPHPPISPRSLFQKAILQSNPTGYSFRSLIVADFLGKGLKREVDCRDLACLRAERVEEIIAAQSSLMGVPRSVGDFFTWGPVLTREVKYAVDYKHAIDWMNTPADPSSKTSRPHFSRSEGHRMLKFDSQTPSNRHRKLFDAGLVNANTANTPQPEHQAARWASVNVSQPLAHLDLIPPEMPLIVGTNAHEGQIFVYAAFPAPMPKAVYWMFVGALFKDSAPGVLRHYRDLVRKLEEDAQVLGQKNLKEEEARQEYLDRREELEREYEEILRSASPELESPQPVPNTGSTLSKLFYGKVRGGAISDWFVPAEPNPSSPGALLPVVSRAEKRLVKLKERLERRIARQKAKALRAAANVAVDYRPVMSTIIDDYLFRCPTWNMATMLSKSRRKKEKAGDVFVYRFSQPTHIPHVPECWGKACHSAELPYVFQAMDIIRSEYSITSNLAHEEAPKPPEYPYSEAIAAFKGDVTNFTTSPVFNASMSLNGANDTHKNHNLLNQFFGEYFADDADEELALDMSERWASFAKSGSPNYEGGRVEWETWARKRRNVTSTTPPSSSPPSPAEDPSDDVEFEEGELFASLYWRDEESEDAYRERVLSLLGLEAAVDDGYRTELRARRKEKGEREERRLWFGLFGGFGKGMSAHEEGEGATGAGYFHYRDIKNQAANVLRLAQDYGVVGEGETTDDSVKVDPDLDPDGAEGQRGGVWFSQLLELSWPPEARIVERDCTCEFWDRIKYKY